ncbi:MAG: LysR family transcriptional regulator, partial [Chloroflexota bacterium]
MEVGQLEAFERAVREGSFTAAAESLGLTQPAISTRIAALERELGGPLFERGGKRLLLTSLGESVLPYADKILSAIKDAQQVANRHQEGKLGSVAIAALDTLGMAMLPEPMTAFLDAYPAVDFTIRLRIKQQILNLLHDGRVSLGLSAAPLWDKGVSVLARFRNPIRAAVSVGHPLAKRRQLTLHSLQSYPIYRSTLSPTATALIQSLTAQARQGNGTGDIYIPAIMAAPLLLQG